MDPSDYLNFFLQLLFCLFFLPIIPFIMDRIYFILLLMIYYHYTDVTMSTVAFQITSLTIVYSTIYSDTDERKHQCSASLALVKGIHRSPVNSPHKGPVTRKMFPFDDVIIDRARKPAEYHSGCIVHSSLGLGFGIGLAAGSVVCFALSRRNVSLNSVTLQVMFMFMVTTEKWSVISDIKIPCKEWMILINPLVNTLSTNVWYQR